MARPIAWGVLSFGLVAIPVEIHTATKSQNVFGLIDESSSKNFEPETYYDEYRNRVVALIDQKSERSRDHRRAEATANRARHRPDGGSEREHENSAARDQKSGAEETAEGVSK